MSLVSVYFVYTKHMGMRGWKINMDYKLLWDMDFSFVLVSMFSAYTIFYFANTILTITVGAVKEWLSEAGCNMDLPSSNLTY